MSRLRRDRARKKFFDILGTAAIAPFLRMIWAVDALQSGRGMQARAHITFPLEAETSDTYSRYFAHKWRLETLVNEAIIHCSTDQLIIRKRLNCESFDAFAEVNNRLNALENVEDGFALEQFDIFDEVYRLTQRQFEWQVGFVSVSAMYRFAYVFSGPLAKAHFENSHGFSLNDFSLFCFACRAAFLEKPFVPLDLDFKNVGLSDSTRDKILNHLKLDHAAAKCSASLAAFAI